MRLRIIVVNYLLVLTSITGITRGGYRWYRLANPGVEWTRWQL